MTRLVVLFMVVLLSMLVLDGRRGRVPTNLHKQTSGAEWLAPLTPRGFIRQTHSAHKRGVTPLHRSSPAGSLPAPGHGLISCPIADKWILRPRLPSSTL